MEPNEIQIAEALAEQADASGLVHAGVARLVARARGWVGRMAEVLDVLDETDEKLSYLAGGRRPDEVATWVSIWADSPLTLQQIRLVTSAGGWDPDPFVVLARAGLLERLLLHADGTIRRVRGEKAGAWASDELALASEEEIVSAARQAIAGEDAALSR